MTDELLPCPGCARAVGEPHEDGGVYFVRCAYCGWRGPRSYHMGNAARMWNDRRTPGGTDPGELANEIWERLFALTDDLLHVLAVELLAAFDIRDRAVAPPVTPAPREAEVEAALDEWRDSTSLSPRDVMRSILTTYAAAQVRARAGEPTPVKEPLDFGELPDEPMRNPRWQPAMQELVYEALTALDGSWDDRDEDANEQIIERLLVAFRRCHRSPSFAEGRAAGIEAARERIVAKLSVELQNHNSFGDATKAMVWATRLYDAILRALAKQDGEGANG